MAEDDEREIVVFRFRVPKNASEVPIPFDGDVADAIQIAATMGSPALLAFLLKMVLRDRITDNEIQLICDIHHHD